MIQAHLLISGDVIGVGYRAWTLRQAHICHVTGWVRNLQDTVEAVVQGRKEDIEKMIGLLQRGPSTGYVENVQVAYQKTAEHFSSFEIRF